MNDTLKNRIEKRKTQDINGFVNNLWLFAEVVFFSIAAIFYSAWMLFCSPFVLVVGCFSFAHSKRLFKALDVWNYFEKVIVHDNLD